MRFVRTAVGHRILTAAGKTVTVQLHAVAQGMTPKGFVVLQVTTPAARATLTEVDREVRRHLGLPAGPWNASAGSLVVKVSRLTTIRIGGQPVGRREDLLRGRDVEARLRLAGAWSGGYVWQAEELTLGGVPGFVPGV